MLGNFTVSSVLPALVLDPKYTSPVSASTSWATLPLRALRRSLTSRSARRCAFAVSNWPAATAAYEVYSPSVANSHG